MRIVKKVVTFKDVGKDIVVGSTQKGDMIVDGGVFVQEAFNGTTPTFNIGFAKDNQGGTADPDALASAIVPTVGSIKADELAATTNKVCTVPDQIVAKFAVASGTPTTGRGIVWFAILNSHPDNG